MSAPLYLALGDDLSLDGEAGPGTGAASRFFRDDGRYAGFEDRDLGHRVPGLVFRNLATEGATSAEVALEQVAALDEVAGELRIVTLTVGRADFLQIWGAESQTGEIAARDLAFSLEEILATARRAAGDDGLLLVTNLPDPTDGTGEWGAFVDAPGRRASSCWTSSTARSRRRRTSTTPCGWTSTPGSTATAWRPRIPTTRSTTSATRSRGSSMAGPRATGAPTRSGACSGRPWSRS
jgi:hypothetical protein